MQPLFVVALERRVAFVGDQTKQMIRQSGSESLFGNPQINAVTDIVHKVCGGGWIEGKHLATGRMPICSRQIFSRGHVTEYRWFTRMLLARRLHGQERRCGHWNESVRTICSQSGNSSETCSMSQVNVAKAKLRPSERYQTRMNESVRNEAAARSSGSTSV